MTRVFLSILTLCIISLSLFSQRGNSGQVYFEDDTIDVIIKIPIDVHSLRPQYEKLQYRVTYFNAKGKKVRLRPAEALGYSFEHDGKQVVMLSRIEAQDMSDLFFKPAPIFLRLIKEGPVTMFKYYYDNSLDDEEVNIVSRYVLQRDEGDLVKIRRNHFKKDITEFFSNCPALVEKVMNKDYGKKNMKAIVRFANSHCE